MRAERQLAHDLGDVWYVREAPRPCLVDVVLQLRLDGHGRVLRHALEELPRAPVGRLAAERGELEHERVLVQTMLGEHAGDPEEERLVARAGDAREQTREELERFLGTVHVDEESDGELEGLSEVLAAVIDALEGAAQLRDALRGLLLHIQTVLRGGEQRGSTLVVGHHPEHLARGLEGLAVLLPLQRQRGALQETPTPQLHAPILGFAELERPRVPRNLELELRVRNAVALAKAADDGLLNACDHLDLDLGPRVALEQQPPLLKRQPHHHDAPILHQDAPLALRDGFDARERRDLLPEHRWHRGEELSEVEHLGRPVGLLLRVHLALHHRVEHEDVALAQLVAEDAVLLHARTHDRKCHL